MPTSTAKSIPAWNTRSARSSSLGTIVDGSKWRSYCVPSRLIVGATSLRSKSDSSVMGPVSARYSTSTKRERCPIAVHLLRSQACLFRPVAADVPQGLSCGQATAAEHWSSLVALPFLVNDPFQGKAHLDELVAHLVVHALPLRGRLDFLDVVNLIEWLPDRIGWEIGFVQREQPLDQLIGLLAAHASNRVCDLAGDLGVEAAGMLPRPTSGGRMARLNHSLPGDGGGDGMGRVLIEHGLGARSAGRPGQGGNEQVGVARQGLDPNAHRPQNLGRRVAVVERVVGSGAVDVPHVHLGGQDWPAPNRDRPPLGPPHAASLDRGGGC